jgi:hypothetical protein
MAASRGKDGIEEDPGEGEIRFKVGGQLWKYLLWLSRHTVLGESHNDVARQVLIQRLSEMRQEDFRAERL